MRTLRPPQRPSATLLWACGRSRTMNALSANDPGHQLDENARVEWLLNTSFHPQRGTGPRRGCSADRDDRDLHERQDALADLAEGPAVDDRHHEVEQDHGGPNR